MMTMKTTTWVSQLCWGDLAEAADDDQANVLIDVDMSAKEEVSPNTFESDGDCSEGLIAVMDVQVQLLFL